MKYQLLFFTTAITLLIWVGLSTFSGLEWYMGFPIDDRGLICLNRNIDPPVFLLLIVMNILLIALYFRPKNDLLWWLNLVGLISLMILTLANFSPGLVLAALSFGFGLAYRRIQGLKHIWHWRGLLALMATVALGFAVVFFGMG